MCSLILLLRLLEDELLELLLYGTMQKHRTCTNCVLCIYKSFSQGSSALQIQFVMLSQFAMQFILVRCFCNSYPILPPVLHEKQLRLVEGPHVAGRQVEFLANLIKCKSVWVWKSGTCNARLAFLENLFCISSKSREAFFVMEIKRNL